MQGYKKCYNKEFLSIIAYLQDFKCQFRFKYCWLSDKSRKKCFTKITLSTQNGNFNY